MDKDAAHRMSIPEWAAGILFGNLLRVRARELKIAHGDNVTYWSWKEDSTSLHSEIAQLKYVDCFDVNGEIICAVRPGAYTLSWRIRLDEPVCCHDRAIHFTLTKDDVQVDERKCVLSKNYVRVQQCKVPTIRTVENGWSEYDVGQFVVESGQGLCHLKFAMKSLTRYRMTGLSLDGVVVQLTGSANVDQTPSISLDSFALRPTRDARVEFVSAGQTSSFPSRNDYLMDRRPDEVAVERTNMIAWVAPGVTVALSHEICIHLAARRLRFHWPRDTSSFGRFWRWCHDPTSKGSVVAELNEVKPFHASGEIVCPLPPGVYILSWRIRLGEQVWYDDKPVHFTLSKDDVTVDERKCVLSRSYVRVEQYKVPTIRIAENGWREFDVGEFVVRSEERMCNLKFAIQGEDSVTGISLDGVVVQPTSTVRVKSMSATTLLSQESHTTSSACDPFYPYFYCLPCQSTTATAATECSKPAFESLVWRDLVDSEVGVDRRLGESKLKIVQELLKQHRDGVRVQEEFHSLSRQRTEEEAEKKRAAAESFFLELRRDIVRSVGQLEKQDYDFLLAWADLPLARLFQSRGGAPMLNNALNLRKEVLECVMPLQGSHQSLVRVCKSYVYTAQYEWGVALISSETKQTTHEVELMSSRTKHEAVLGYATLMACNEGEAEAQLCFLLCVDHEYSGSSKESWRWIHEANRLWERNSPNEENRFRGYFLHYEAKILMDLGNYQEAVKLLEDCVSEIKKGTSVIDHSQLAVYDEKLAESQRQIQRSLDGVDLLVAPGTANQGPEFADFHDRARAGNKYPIGSSLGLMQVSADVDICSQKMRKLPEPILSILQSSLLPAAINAREHCDWRGEICNYEKIRDLLKETKRFAKIDVETYDWLLSWFDLRLAHLYQFRAEDFVSARKIWEEMRNCAKNQMGSGQVFLTQGYQIMIDALIVEQREKDDQNAVTEDPAAAFQYFWLYFWHHRFQNWKLASDWLQKAKTLKDRNCGTTKSSENGYFPSDYFYFLGVDDLLHRANGLQLPHELSLLVEIHKDEDRVSEQSPSPAGIVLQVNDKFAMQSRLVQSQVGLEYHLHNLPVIFHLAFRVHSNRGLSYYSQNKWDEAIFDFEWCKEILKLVLTVEPGSTLIAEAYSWLMIWASLPLINIYLFKKHQFEKALDLQREMERMIPVGDSDDLKDVKHHLRIATLTTVYQCCVSNPVWKEMVVRDFGGQISNNDEKASENYLLTELFYAYMDNGNFQAALGFIQKAKQCLLREHADLITNNVELEALCYINLGMHDAAREVIKNYQIDTRTPSTKLPPRMKQMEATGFMANKLFTPDKSRDLDPRRLEKRERVQKICDKIFVDNKRSDSNELEKELRSFEGFSVDPVDSTGKVKGQLEDDLEYEDYFLLSGLRVSLCVSTIKSCNSDPINSDQIKAFRHEENFQRAVICCEKYMLLAPDSAKPVAVARANLLLTQLYGALDSKYFEYLLLLMKNFIRTVEDANHSDISGQQSYLNDELCSYFKMEVTQVQKYGKEAADAYADLLTSSSYSEDQWLRFLEQNKQLFSLLQVYHSRRAELCEFLFRKIDRRSQIKDQRSHWVWTAFMYAEAERSQSMLYQLLGSSKRNSSSRSSLYEEEGLRATRLDAIHAVPRNGVFVQYSNLVDDGRAFIIYVYGAAENLRAIKIDVEQELREEAEEIRKAQEEAKCDESSPHCTKQEPRTDLRSLVDRLNDMYKFLERGNRDPKKCRYDADSLMKDLEFLYDLLIKPFAHLLNEKEENPYLTDEEREEHALILAPNEIFTKVPFAALRDRRSGKYLIESHAISLTPSLRVLRACTERLKELQCAPLQTDHPGSIVALGDPTYDCSKCKKNKRRKALPQTGEEVETIAKMFGSQTQVVSLKEKLATAKELLHWASQPAERGFRQPILHIGAHGLFDKKDHRHNSLVLACDPALSSSTDGRRSSSSNHGASISGTSRGQPDEILSSDDDASSNASDTDDEPDMTVDRNSSSQSMSICIDTMVDSGFLKIRRGSRNRGDDLVDNSHCLTAELISNSNPKWNAELVVLSACQTARGRETTEGVLSMARSFIIAGVPCVVASLWKVDDDATKDLMISFYDALRKGATVVEALRLAMVHHLRIDPQKVREWAPFNVWGVPSLHLPLQLSDRYQYLYRDPNPPRFRIQTPEKYNYGFQRSHRSYLEEDRPMFYSESYGDRNDNPYDSVFYGASRIKGSEFKLALNSMQLNSMYKWSWFKEHGK